MVKLTCCPECSTIYDLEGIDLSSSKGWVQCGDCNTKFESELHSIDDIPTVIPKKEKTDPESEDVFVDENPVEKSSRKNIAVEDFLFDAEDIDNFSTDVDSEALNAESEEAMEMDNHRHFRNAFIEPVSEFADEPLEIEPVDNTRKTPLEEELENNRIPKITKAQKTKALIRKYLCIALASAVFVCLLLVLVLQLQGRGAISAIPEKKYADLLEKYPTLQFFEKNKSDLSSLSINDSQLKSYNDGLAIRIKVSNNSILKQSYPNLELEFQNSKGDPVARKLITPDMYLKKGLSGVILGKRIEIIYLNLSALPQGAVGYQVKIVNNPG